MRSVHLVHYLTTDQIPAERVRDREWIAPLAVTCTKPSLKVDAPTLVWGSYVAERLGRRCHPSSYALGLGQTSSIENLTDRAGSRPVRAWVQMFEARSDLARAPCGMSVSDREHLVSICSGIAWEQLFGRRLSSDNPSGPSCSYRLIHLYAVGRDIPNCRHRSIMVVSFV